MSIISGIVHECSWLMVPLLVTAGWNVSASSGAVAPNQVIIEARHWGWSDTSTNLTLRLTNGFFAAGPHRVTVGLVSNVVSAAKRPWPAVAPNAWPKFTIDAANLGFTPAWLKANYNRLLESYSPKPGVEPFPTLSSRQQAWLTNALADLSLLGEAVRGSFGEMWTDDYPSMEVRFEYDDGATVEQLFRIKSTAQPAFMLPWEVYEGTKVSVSGNADISRAVVEILPVGFLLRNRLNPDLVGMASAGFVNLNSVRKFIERTTLEQTVGSEAEVLKSGFELRNCWLEGSLKTWPGALNAAVHRTNWPERVTMPIRGGIEGGVVTNLQAILSKADARVSSLIRQQWLISRLKGATSLSLEVESEGSPDRPWLRGHMQSAKRAGFYDRIQPALQRSTGVMLREGYKRASYWALFDDGRLLLYGFSGDGVVDWKADQLGFNGSTRLLQGININYVGVFVGSDGEIKEMIPAEAQGE